MKVRVLPVEDGLEPKFRVIAETTEDEIFLKQLSGMYGDGTLSLEDVIFNGDGVSSLIVVGDAFPFPGDFCTRVAQCMASATPEAPAVQAPNVVLVENTTFNINTYSLDFIGAEVEGDQLYRLFDPFGNDIGGLLGTNVIGADNLFNSILGGNNLLGDSNQFNRVIGTDNTLGNGNNINSISGGSNTIGDNNTGIVLFGNDNTIGNNVEVIFIHGIQNEVDNSVQFGAAFGEGHHITDLFSYYFGNYSQAFAGGGIAFGNGVDDLNRSNAFELRRNGSIRHKGAYANKPTRYTSGGSVVIGDNVSVFIYDPAIAQAGATITLPANPIDGHYLCILGGGTVTVGNVITGFTLDGNGRTIIGDGAANLKVGKAYDLHYCAENNIWYAISH